MSFPRKQLRRLKWEILGAIYRRPLTEDQVKMAWSYDCWCYFIKSKSVECRECSYSTTVYFGSYEFDFPGGTFLTFPRPSCGFFYSVDLGEEDE